MYSRTVISRYNAQTFRRVATRRVGHRFQSTSPSSSAGIGASHVAAGIAGGATVALIGYAWYHTSGLKTVVQTSKQMKSYMESARDRAIESAKANLKSPNEALNYLRGVARSYSAVIPGAQSYVDTTFDSLEELSETHGEKMTDIVGKARDELVNIGQKGGADIQTASAVYEVLRRTIKELQELGLQMGGDLLEKHPKLKERIGGGYDELKKLAETKGPQAKKIFDDTTNQIREMISKGVNSDTLDQARRLVQDKTAEIGKLTGAGSIKLGDQWETLQSFIKSMPGGEEALKKAPNVKEFVALASDKSEDAKKLAQETYQEIIKVLEEKGQKAKQLKDETKEDAKKSKDKK